MSLFRSSTDLPRLNPIATRRSQIVSVLDVGSEKMTCLIARLRPREGGPVLPDRTHTIEVVGIGHQRSRGIKSGTVADIAAAAQAIRATVEAAERMAGLTVESLVVTMTAGRLKSYRGRGAMKLMAEVGGSDVAYVTAQAARVGFEENRLALHTVPTDLLIDGEGGIEDPTGMIGDELTAEVHVLTAEEGPLRNLEAAINRAHLVVEAFVATPYASALSTLVEDEAAMGAAAIDIGGGTTTIAIFQNSRFVYADQIAVGGQHVTMDLARGLSIRQADAERLKVMHGSTLSALSGDGETIQVQTLGEEGPEAPVNVSRSVVSKIIRPRVEEILELVRDRLAASGLGHVIGKRVVLTGGASQLAGLSDTARTILQRNVRLGRPVGVSGLAPANKSPAFAAAVGLLIYPQVVHREAVHQPSFAARMLDPSTRAGRFGTWLRRSM